MDTPGPIPYKRFRTGYTYKDVYYMIYNRKHKRRRGVLGYWHQLKQSMYAEYLHSREWDSAAPAHATDPGPIPD